MATNRPGHRTSALRRAALVVAMMAALAPDGMVAPAAAETLAAPSASAALPAWGHEQAQRAPDPAVRFGRLPNGLRYAIQRNQTPEDGVAMRMRIGAGSLDERDEEQGLAHFLEHMAFRGSAKLPDGEVVRLLERQGLSFGPDTNAFTAQDHTVYMFNFPRADATALDTGFTLFAEIGQHLTLDAELVEQEKGVVLSEERVRDVPAQRAYQSNMNNVLAGTRIVQRWPIGQVATIQAATPERLRRYYQAHYRPDNATVVVVGNIDVDAVERQIRERFADWKSAGQPAAVALGTPKPAQPAVEFISEGAPDTLAMTWVLPADKRVATLAVERERLVEQLAVSVLSMHLANGLGTFGAQANVVPVTFNGAVLAVLAQLVVLGQPAQWQAALDVAVEELRRLLQDGVQPADLQRVLSQMRSMQQAAVAQEPTRQSAAIADALVNAANGNGVYTSAKQALADVEPMLSTLKPEELSSALRRMFGGKPVIFRSVASGGVGAPALSQHLAQTLSRPLQARAAQVAADWPYTDFGAPAAIVSQVTDAELGSTTVQFANGTRLVVKSTAQDKDKVSVQVALGQGLSGIPKERTHALWAMGAWPLGGTAKRSMAEYRQWKQTAGKLLEWGTGEEPYAFVLAGDTRPADLRTHLQVMAAFARDPGFRPELGEQLAIMGPALVSQFDADASMVYQRELDRVMNSGERRLAGVIPTAADVAATRAEDLSAVLREALASAADIVIVGDVSVDEAIAVTQATFGAGPSRPRPPRLVLRPPAPVMPADGGATHVVRHGGRADQALLGRIWTMPDHWTDPALSATGRVAAAIVQARLVDSVREKLGVTYSPSASGGGSIDIPGQGSFRVQLETPPDKFDTFRSLLQVQLRELADKPVSADELHRARQPMVESSSRATHLNGHWVNWLARILSDARMKGAMLGETALLHAVTAEQVQAFFQDHIVGRTPVEVVSKAR